MTSCMFMLTVSKVPCEPDFLCGDKHQIPDEFFQAWGKTLDETVVVKDREDSLKHVFGVEVDEQDGDEDDEIVRWENKLSKKSFSGRELLGISAEIRNLSGKF
ncbi:hypothetical protein VNO78_10239 [Psophocarpus tetragonolobus]|uniref:Uncharacterized protein n=1 Tax=Psophocarpus tetragonolobus TaxID=3891 RepID=A0AAN9SQQ7_PSOTE